MNLITFPQNVNFIHQNQFQVLNVVLNTGTDAALLKLVESFRSSSNIIQILEIFTKDMGNMFIRCFAKFIIHFLWEGIKE